MFKHRQRRAPYALITNTGFESLPSTVPSDHACIYYAQQMSLIHNTIVRAVNASHHHCLSFMAEAPESPNSMAVNDPKLGSSLEDIANFLEYNQLIFKMLDHHHHVEEEFMFQQIEDLLVAVGRPRGSMQDNISQHQAFEAGLAMFGAYVFKTQPVEFQPHTMLNIIESFASTLVEHLHDEIPTLLALHVLDSKDLMKIWDKAAYEATKDDDMYTALPFVLGCQDPTFELDGEKRLFPPIPRMIRPALVMANKHWFSRRKAGVWRYLPCKIPSEDVRPSSITSSKFHEEI